MKHIQIFSVPTWIALASMSSAALGQSICTPDPCVDSPGINRLRQFQEAPALPLEELKSLGGNKWIVLPGGTWKPGRSVKDRLKFTLASYVERYARFDRHVLRDWNSYTFQIQGRGQKKRKQVLVNAFCTSPPDHAKLQLVTSNERGTCYFRVSYDPATGQYSSLEFGGLPEAQQRAPGDSQRPRT